MPDGDALVSHTPSLACASETDNAEKMPEAPEGGLSIPLMASGLVEVKGLEPSASTLRMSGSRRFDQGLSGDLPGDGVAIPSRSLRIPPVPSR